MLRLIVTFCLFIFATSLECPLRFENADRIIPYLSESYSFSVNDNSCKFKHKKLVKNSFSKSLFVFYFISLNIKNIVPTNYF